VNGAEPWTSDGTNGGTRMITDVRPGAGSSSPDLFTLIYGRLYFRADNGVHGSELWRSERNTLSAATLEDLNPGAGGSSPTNLARAGSALWFAASTPSAGSEPWIVYGDSDGDGVVDANDNCPAVPNASQADCDLDGVGDACAIAAGAADCNGNGLPDACDTGSGASQDANANGIPDECEIGGGQLVCAGDGGAGACPCGNESPAGDQAGCRNSLGLGAKLRSSGLARVNSDNFALLAYDMPSTSSALFFQGSQYAPAAFGDGLRCAGGSVVRLGSRVATSGIAFYPGPGEALVSIAGVVAAGDTRVYQAWYRNNANYCTSAAFNLTNGLSVLWTP
jgi:ELWxxDGT repeat protein